MEMTMKEKTMKRGLSIAVESAVLLVAVLASCGGPPEAGFARLELSNNTDSTITLVEMDGETIYNSSNGIAVGSTYEKVVEFVVTGTHTFTAKNGTQTLGTATESIEVNTTNYQPFHSVATAPPTTRSMPKLPVATIPP
jgi:hypothetical protein